MRSFDPPPPDGYREGPPRAYRPIRCHIEPGFDNHFAFCEVPMSEVGKREDPRAEPPSGNPLVAGQESP